MIRLTPWIVALMLALSLPCAKATAEQRTNLDREIIYIAQPLRSSVGRLPACTPLQLIDDGGKKVSMRLASGFPGTLSVPRKHFDTERFPTLDACLATLPSTLRVLEIGDGYEARRLSIGDPIMLAHFAMGIAGRVDDDDAGLDESIHTWRLREPTRRDSVRFIAARSFTLDRLLAACEVRLRADKAGDLVTISMQECLPLDEEITVADESIDHRFGVALADYRGGRHAEAFARWEEIARQGHAPSQYSLAEMLLFGDGVEKDVRRAAELYKKAADAAYGPAEYRLGFLYLNGTGVEANPSEAYRLLESSVKNKRDKPAREALQALEKTMSRAQIVEATSDGRPDRLNPPKRIESSYLRPSFPVQARIERTGGSVTMRARIHLDGSTDELVVLSCSSPGLGFEYATMEAVARWRYDPAERNRKAQSVHFEIWSDFSLR